MKIILGNKVRDIVTGFEGIAICAKAVDYKVEDSQAVYVDIGQVEKVDDGIKIPKKNTGGVMPNPPRSGYGMAR